MDNIWSPWRMEFIHDQRQKGKEGPCVFCELKEQVPNNKNLVLHKGKQVYVVMNRFPYTNGHLLVLPYAHLTHLKELNSDGQQEIMKLMAESMDILRAALHVDGFNCGMNVGKVSGCGIEDHFHWHIVPRWVGDSNFMPILSDMRLMPQYLSDTYQHLIEGFKKLGG